jgi:hypothetical protein
MNLGAHAEEDSLASATVFALWRFQRRTRV